jgi:hypothetical protein
MPTTKDQNAWGTNMKTNDGPKYVTFFMGKVGFVVVYFESTTGTTSRGLEGNPCIKDYVMECFER